MKEYYDTKLHETLRKRKTIRVEYDDFKKEETCIKEELKITKAHLATLLETLHDAEFTERNERKLNEENERKVEMLRATEKFQEERTLRETKVVLQAALDDVQSAELNLSEKNDTLNIELRTLTEINEEEIHEAQSKIDQVVGKKKEMLDEKAKILIALKHKIDNMEKKLDELRKIELLKNSTKFS